MRPRHIESNMCRHLARDSCCAAVAVSRLFRVEGPEIWPLGVSGTRVAGTPTDGPQRPQTDGTLAMDARPPINFVSGARRPSGSTRPRRRPWARRPSPKTPCDAPP